MKAIILAAGRGNRMGHLTDDLPKCRTVFNGKELIQWQIDSLLEAGIKDISIVRGYLRETFTFDLTYFDNLRWDETNMVSSLLTANEALLSDTCIISYSDIVYSSDAVMRLIKCNGDICITYDPNWKKLWDLRFDDPLTDAETFKIKNGFLSEIGKRTINIDEIEGQYMGLFKFTKSGWKKTFEYLNKLDKKLIDNLDMTTLFQLLIENKCNINVTAIADKWYEIDAISDLEKYIKTINH